MTKLDVEELEDLLPVMDFLLTAKCGGTDSPKEGVM